MTEEKIVIDKELADTIYASLQAQVIELDNILAPYEDMFKNRETIRLAMAKLESLGKAKKRDTLPDEYSQDMMLPKRILFILNENGNNPMTTGEITDQIIIRENLDFSKRFRAKMVKRVAVGLDKMVQNKDPKIMCVSRDFKERLWQLI